MRQEILRGVGCLRNRKARRSQQADRDNLLVRRTMPALGRRVAFSYSIPEREIHELELSSKMVGNALRPTVPPFVPRAFRSAVRLLSQPFARPFSTRPCFAAQ